MLTDKHCMLYADEAIKVSDSRVNRAAERFQAIHGVSWSNFVTRTGLTEDILFREVAESLPLFIWAKDESGNKLFCNQKYLQSVGLQSPTGMEDGWPLDIHPRDRQRARDAWEAAVASGGEYECECRLRRVDGSYRVFLTRAVPISDAAGRVVRWLGTSVDLHDRYLAEATERRTERILAALRCASSVAHHVNNPLAGATNAIFLAQQDPALSQATRSYLNMAAAQISRAAHVTARSLGFHKQSGDMQQTDVACVIESVLSFFQPCLLEQGLTFRLDVRPTPRIDCYPEDVSQAISSMLLNAVQASPRGASIRVRLRPHGTAESPGIRITIADSGSGIPQEVREELFEPFVSTRGSAGAGLGLWMCQEIVRRHGGTIRFRSCVEPRRGTVFVIFLPLHRAGAEQ